jgi:hypothetical protein
LVQRNQGNKIKKYIDPKALYRLIFFSVFFSLSKQVKTWFFLSSEYCYIWLVVKKEAIVNNKKQTEFICSLIWLNQDARNMQVSRISTAPYRPQVKRVNPNQRLSQQNNNNNIQSSLTWVSWFFFWESIIFCCFII